jgi:hypothetical protein
MNELPQFIISGLKSIHEITNNIDFKKTTEDYVQAQLKIKMNDKIQNDENFFNFLQKNDKHLKNLKVFCIFPEKEQSLKEHISHHFRNINTKYDGDKLFYFYFQIVMVEKYLNSYGNDLKRQDLKIRLENLLKTDCLREQLEHKQCLSKNHHKIDVIVMSDLQKNVSDVCNSQTMNLDKCIGRYLYKKRE